MQKIILLFIFFLFLGCSFDQSIEKNEYDYFTVKSFPEKSEFYPEETIKFVFNQEPTVDSKSKITFTCEENVDCSPEIKIEKKILTISNLPPNDTLQIVFNIGIKSTENKPLTFKNKENIFSSEKKSFKYTIGPKLPILKEVIPSKDTISKVYFLEFSNNVSLEKSNISPQPKELFGKDESFLLLFDETPKKITIKNLKTPIRNGKIKEISFSPTKQKESNEIKTTMTCTDISCNISFSGKGLLAIKKDKEIAKCLGKCDETEKNLTPQTTYSKDFVLFTMQGKITKELTYTTKKETAHIMISEVMHTPKNTPEKSWEFVELFNNSNKDFDLKDCIIDDNNDGKGADPLISTVNQTILKPGEFAVIVAKESALIPILSNTTNLFTVDDTTIADGGLTSQESIQIKCPDITKQLKTVAFFQGGIRTQRGFSVIIDENSQTCESSKEGGSPGEEESCDEQ